LSKTFNPGQPRVPAPTYARAAIDPQDAETRAELQMFSRGIKWHKTQYPEIKDERNFDNWQRSFLGTAESHNMKNVFNTTYIPGTDDEIALFAKKQKFAYSVLEHTLKLRSGTCLYVNIKHKKCTTNMDRI
jgi:hypothetical protein